MPTLPADNGDPLTGALNDIFTDYLAKYPLFEGRYDRDVRNPSIILDMIESMDLTPNPRRTVTITGSKGKGTVARAVAANLTLLGPSPQSAFGIFEPDLATKSGNRVGLIVSPNEVEQTDRIRIDGIPIERSDFLAAYEAIRERLWRVRASLTPPAYVSPFGIFLLLGLYWFRKRNADWIVLEGGRGAAFDEVGRMAAEVAVVTSIEDEHRDQLGPTLADTAHDKMTIATSAKTCLLGPGVAETLKTLNIPMPPNAIAFDSAWIESTDPTRPHWLTVDMALGRQAALRMTAGENLDHWLRNRPPPPPIGGSFGFGHLVHRQTGERVDILFDATGRPQTLDVAWYRRALTRWKNPTAILCLSDQKDPVGLARCLEGLELPYSFLILEDAPLHRFDTVKAAFPDRLIRSIGYSDQIALVDRIESIIGTNRNDLVICLGIQPFIRLVRAASLPQ